jgi:hypothetical protein
MHACVVAQALGLPLLPPSKARGEDFRRGANMAMIGGTARDYSGTSMFTGYGVHLDGSMDSQMEALRRLLPSICGTPQSNIDHSHQINHSIDSFTHAHARMFFPSSVAAITTMKFNFVHVRVYIGCKEYLAKSLFVFQLGENDYNIQLVNGSTVHEARKSIPSIVNTITSGVEVTINLKLT